MKKLFLILLIFSATVSILFSQNEIDALRYSYSIHSGTARSSAMGGSFGALGADPSSLIFNPAGIGVYKTSELSVTPSFEFTRNRANYLGKTIGNGDFGIKLNNLSYIGTIPTFSDENNINFGFSYNRLNSFNENITMGGVNDANSITDWFASRAYNTHPQNLADYDNFYSYLAYETYLIDPIGADSISYVSVFNERGQNQRQVINRDGYQGEWNFALSGSIGRKLFIGASLGIQTVRYSEIKNLEETDPDGLIHDFISLRLHEYLSTRGSGANFKIGMIYSPIEWLRIGAALHTPTYFTLRDEYNTSLASKFEINNDVYSAHSADGYYKYNLKTPLKANASVGFIFSNILINIDYEHLNYSKAKLKELNYSYSDDNIFNPENETIKTIYKSANNLKIGAEYRYGALCFRLGGAYYGSPYESNYKNKKYHTLVYSGGVGLRYNDAYFDLAYSLINNSHYYNLYTGNRIESPLAKITKYQNRIAVTIGFKF